MVYKSVSDVPVLLSVCHFGDSCQAFKLPARWKLHFRLNSFSVFVVCVCVCVFDRHFHTLVCDILYVTKNDSAPHIHRNVNFVAKGLHFVTSRWIKSENLHNKNLNRRFLCILSHATLPKKPKTTDRPNRTRPKKNIFYYNWLDVYCNFTVLPKCLCQTIEMRSRTILNFLSSN